MTKPSSTPQTTDSQATLTPSDSSSLSMEVIVDEVMAPEELENFEALGALSEPAPASEEDSYDILDTLEMPVFKLPPPTPGAASAAVTPSQPPPAPFGDEEPKPPAPPSPPAPAAPPEEHSAMPTAGILRRSRLSARPSEPLPEAGADSLPEELLLPHAVLRQRALVELVWRQGPPREPKQFQRRPRHGAVSAEVVVSEEIDLNELAEAHDLAPEELLEPVEAAPPTPPPVAAPPSPPPVAAAPSPPPAPALAPPLAPAPPLAAAPVAPPPAPVAAPPLAAGPVAVAAPPLAAPSGLSYDDPSRVARPISLPSVPALRPPPPPEPSKAEPPAPPPAPAVAAPAPPAPAVAAPAPPAPPSAMPAPPSAAPLAPPAPPEVRRRHSALGNTPTAHAVPPPPPRPPAPPPAAPKPEVADIVQELLEESAEPGYTPEETGQVIPPQLAWYENIFTEEYFRTLPQAFHKQTRRESQFIADCLEIGANGRILDLACGFGRHSIEMAKRGYDMVGLDLSLALLQKGLNEAQRRKLSVKFIHGDIRQLNFTGVFDACFSFHTSFGYFDDKTNFEVLCGVHRALKPGGRFLLEMLNRDFVVQMMPRRKWWEGNECIFLEEIQFNFATSVLHTKRSFIYEDGRPPWEQNIYIRLFSLHELQNLFQHAGFHILEVSGDISSRRAFFGPESKHLILLAEKRA